jgi:hypothetical protein
VFSAFWRVCRIEWWNAKGRDDRKGDQGWLFCAFWSAG